MAKNNTEILTQIAQDASAEYKSRMLDTEGKVLTGEQAYRALSDYPTAKNEFINTLTNKIVKSYFYSKVFSNPLKMLHRGELPFGTSLEQLFVGMATKKNFTDNFGASASESLISKQASDVKAMYIEKNFAYKYKVSISELQLKGAFYSQTGLSELVGQLTNSAISGAYYDEFTDMKKVISNAVASGKDFKDDTLSASGSNITLKPVKSINVGTHPQEWAENIRALSGRLRFPSDAYNMASVKTWSNPEDLVLITTPEKVAKIDVEVLALAFNTSMTDIKIKVIEVDDLPNHLCVTLGTQGSTQKDLVGIVMDKDWLQCYDTIMTSRQFENGDNLVTNQFLHKQGVMASCLFANMVALVNEQVGA